MKERRPSQGKPRNSYVYIFSAGKTEKNYFDRLIQKRHKYGITIAHCGYTDGKNGTALVEYANYYEYKDKKPDLIYLVFDRDKLTLDGCKEAEQLASVKNYKIGFSNHSFELWLLLHYEKVTIPMEQKELEDKLSQYIGQQYKKQDNDLHCIIGGQAREKDAVLNTNSFPKTIQWDTNPYTNLGYLVKELFLNDVGYP